MQRNITALGRANARAILAPSEKALDFIAPNHIIIVDPPRAGLHADVVARLLEVMPPRIIYLSCNPITQARDIALLAKEYSIHAHQGYNFFPRTPHIEHLVVLDRNRKNHTISSKPDRANRYKRLLRQQFNQCCCLSLCRANQA